MLKWQVVLIGLVACACCYLFFGFGICCLFAFGGQGKQLDGVAGAIQPCLDAIAFGLVALRFHPSRNFHYCAFGEVFCNT